MLVSSDSPYCVLFATLAQFFKFVSRQGRQVRSDTLAPSYRVMATSSTGAVAAAAEDRKQAKYANLSQGYSFTPVAIETLDAIGPKSLAFLKDLGRGIQGYPILAPAYIRVRTARKLSGHHGHYDLLVLCVCPLFSSFSLLFLFLL